MFPRVLCIFLLSRCDCIRKVKKKRSSMVGIDAVDRVLVPLQNAAAIDFLRRRHQALYRKISEKLHQYRK